MNKALYIPALFLSLASSSLPGADLLPGTAASLSSMPAVVPGGVFPVSATAMRATPQEPPATRHADNTNARFGTQKLAYQSLIHRDQDRPGAVAEWRPGLQTDVRGFVFHPDIKSGPRKTAESPDLEHQLLGVVAAHAFPLRNGDTLTFNSGWVAGSDLADQSAADSMAPATRAWSLGAGASLLESRLQLSFEQAGAGLDEPGIISGKRAEARQFVAEWQADRTRLLRWHAAAEYSWVGPDFDSAANTEVKADRERLRSHGGFSIVDWRFRLSAQRERDNLVSDPLRSTEQQDRYRAIVNWTPSHVGADWALGRPQFQLDAELGENQRVQTSEVRPEVSAYRSLQFESEFRTGTGRWGARAMRSQTPGAIDSSKRAGINTARFELYRDQRDFKAFPVRTQLHWQLREDRVTGTTQDRWQGLFGSRPITIHERLCVDFDLRYRHQVQSNNGVPQKDVNFGGRVVWTVDRPTANRSGLALALNADYLDRHSTSRSDEDGYRLLLVLSNTNPLAGW